MEFQTVLENRRSVRSYRMPTTRNTLCEFLELSRCSPNLSRKEVLSSKLGSFFSYRFFLATRVKKGQRLKSLSLPHFHISL